MSRLVDIDDEKFWDVLFDEACVEGKQAERIKTELESIIAFDTKKVAEQLACNSRFIDDINEHNIKCISCVIGQKTAIDIVKKGGV